MTAPIIKFSSVCIIDDNEIDLFIQEKVVENSGLAEKIISFSSPFKAIEYFTELTEQGESFPELILLDINMPGMNGFKFLEKFEALPSKKKDQVRCIIVTSSESIFDKERAEQFPRIEKLLVKPLDVNELNNI